MVQRDVTPHVTIEIDQNGVEASDAVKQFRDIVVRLNLGGVRVPLNAQRGHERFAELMPVHFRVGSDVGVVVTYRTVDFTQNLDLLQLTILTFHTVRHVCHLFTHRGGSGRLTVGTGQQRNITIFDRQCFYRVDDFTPVRQHHVFARGGEHQRMRQVVNVF